MFAPNVEQMHVVDHAKGEPTQEKRNVLVESARLARGNIQDLSKLSVKDHDAIIFPGDVTLPPPSLFAALKWLVAVHIFSVAIFCKLQYYNC